MARKRRSFKNFKSVRVNASQAVPALVTLDLSSDNLLLASDSAYRLLSLEMTWSWVDVTNLVDGAMIVGVAHGDYITSEIEEWIEATTSIVRGDKIANERANRLIRQIGVFSSLVGGVAEGDAVLMGGAMIKTKLNWPIEIGEQVKFWIYNASTATTATGSNLQCTGKANIVYT